jgi:hypothetical protein
MNSLEDMFTLNLPQEGGGQPAGEVEGQPAGEAAAAAQDNCACTSWAVVNTNGNLVRDFGVNAAARVGLGLYRVIFNRNVTGCAYTATIGLAGRAGNPPSGEISVSGIHNNPNGVLVATYTSTGANADRPFHLAVHCRQQD